MNVIMEDGFETEMSKAKKALDFSKIRIIRNILGIGNSSDQDLQFYFHRACELAWELAKRENRNGEWAFAEVGGFVVWASVNDAEPSKPLLHASYRIEGWDNLD